MTERVVTSLQNERIKAIRALDMRKVRRETGLYVAEGVSVLAMARHAGIAPRTLVTLAGAPETPTARQIVSWALQQRAEVLAVSEPVLAKIAAKDNPQTMLAVFEQRFADAPRPDAVGPADTWVALEEIRDPGNLGTIIRTVHAAGTAGIVLVGTCCDPYARDCVRATMGSIFHVPLVRMESPQFLALLTAWPGETIATDLSSTHDFRAGNTQSPELVVMGREGPGLSAQLAHSCRRRVRIPMAGSLDSLNLAVATALMLYEVRRDRL
jgi:TrmH family RNA methyltransferase